MVNRQLKYILTSWKEKLQDTEVNFTEVFESITDILRMEINEQIVRAAKGRLHTC
jgi:hypothetical protein